MASSLALSFHFLDPRFHGRGDGGEPEWPPSPLRAFQALVAAAAAMHRGGAIPPSTIAAFDWLERTCEASPPRVIAPPTLAYGTGYRLSVPNNALDLVGKAWSRGNTSMEGDANPATHRAMKTVRPACFRDGDTVHFLFSLGGSPSAGEAAHVEALGAVARNVVALGWGVDLVAARASVLSDGEIDAIEGERWLPAPSSRRGLRVPKTGTREALDRRHRAFLERIDESIWRPPPAFTCFDMKSYRRPGDVEERAWAAFALRSPTDVSRFRAFDPVRETVVVAGRLRHATRGAALASGPPEWPDAQIASFVLGHGEVRGSGHAPPGKQRFAYLPLPTIHTRGEAGERAGAIRRVLLTAFSDDCDGEIAWAETALAGRELVDESTKASAALLEPMRAEGDAVLSRYVPRRGASSWASVTPVVLPGYDDPEHFRRRLAKGVGVEEQHRLIDKLERRIDALLRRAIMHAGVPDIFAERAVLSWQRAGFFPGVEHANRYRVPSHLARFPRFHVRIDWRDVGGDGANLPGPLCIGGGRFYGIGLFATAS